MRLVFDPVFGEVDLTASVEELASLAGAVAEGDRLIRSTSPSDDDTLAGVEVRKASGPGIRIELDAARQVLVIGGDPGARAILAADLQSMATAEDGGHLHIDYFPGHPYLVEGSLPVVVNSPHGGMPTR
ncbi:Imm32 family immunity protein [Nocardia xishanensis]|uniref:Imm32 family immunity protein n=1 Tax=Nocardia xishanensis TaxID=238964 RepID=UPI003441E1D0